MENQELDSQDQYRQHIKEFAPRAKTEIANRVLRFMKEANQPVPSFPCDPGPNIRRLAAELIMEEAMETVEALGFRAAQTSGGKMELYGLEGSDVFSLNKSVDGMLDTIYVCHWGMNAMGVADMLPMLEVCDSNDRKTGPGATYNEHGKIQKPPGWVGPDIEGALAAQQREKEE